MCPHKRLPVFCVLYELIVGPIASGSVRFLPPRWELLFLRGDCRAILIPDCREVKQNFRVHFVAVDEL